MALPIVKFDGYKPFPLESIRNKNMVQDEDAIRLVNNTIALSRYQSRNIASGIGYGPDDGATDDITCTLGPGQSGATIIPNLDLDGMISGFNKVARLWIYAKHSDLDSGAEIRVSLGRDSDSINLSTTSSDFQWYTINLDVDPIFNPAMESKLQFGMSVFIRDEMYATTDTIKIRSISFHEPGDDNALTWIDTSGATNQLAKEDFPLSAAVFKIFATQQAIIAGNRIPKANIFNRCFNDGLIYYNIEATNAYGAAVDRLGRWIIPKAKGITQLDFGYYVKGDVGTMEVKFSLYSISSFTYKTQTANFTVGALIRGRTSKAIARILSQIDLGTTGTIRVGYTTNGPFVSGEIVDDSQGGSATVDVVGSQSAITNVTDTPDANGWGTCSISGLVDGFAEYELRFDAKSSSASAEIHGTNAFACEHNTVYDDASLPNAWRVEQDDDITLTEWQRVKECLLQIWNEHTRILLNDFHNMDLVTIGGGAVQYAGTNRFINNSINVFESKMSRHILWPSRSTKYIKANAVYKRSPSPWMIEYTGLAGTLGQIYSEATGTTSNASTRMLEVGIANQFSYSALKDNFVYNEQLGFPLGTATASKTPVPVNVQIEAWMSTTDGDSNAGEYLDIDTILIATNDRDREFKLEHKIAIDPNYRNTLVYTNRPYHVILSAYSANRADHLILDRFTIIEESLGKSIWYQTEEDML